MKRAAVAMAIALSAGCGEIGKRPVVTMGSESLTLEELRRVYADLPPSARPSLSTRPQRVAFVDDVVRRRLLIEHAGELALEDSTTVLDARRERDDIVLGRLVALEGGMGDPTEAELERARSLFATRFLVRRFSFASREEAERAAERLAAGTSADELAVELAADPRCRVSGKDPVTWFPWPMDALAEALVELAPGEFTPPLDSESAVFLAQLLERSAPAPNAESPSESRLAEAVRRRKRAHAVDALEQRLRAAADVRFQDEVFLRVIDATRAEILNGNRAENDSEFAIPSIASQDAIRPIATYRGADGREQRLLAAEYVQGLRRWNPARRPWRGALDAQVRRAVQMEIGRRLLVEEAQRRNVDTDWWAQRALRAVSEEQSLRRAQRAIEASISPTEAGIDSMTALILAAQPGALRRPERARVLRADFNSPEAAREERERAIAAGGLARRFADVLDGRALSTGSYHILRISEGGVGSVEIDRLVFSRRTGSVEGPVRFGASWVLFEVQRFEPEGERTPEVLRDEVRSSLREGRGNSAVDSWVRARREVVGVTVDEKLLDRLSPGV